MGFVAGPRQQLEAGLIGHGAARHEERGLLAEHLGDPLLKAVDRRILAILIVADGRLRHRQPHAG
jgi:hypothetical protein